MNNSPIRNQSYYQDKIRYQRSPYSDKENIMSEVNQSQQTFQREAIEILNDVAETSKIDESVLDSNLTLFEKITHHKWQIRRLVLMNLTEEYQKNQTVYEFQSAWLKNIINDSNQFAMTEGLKFIQVFVRSQQMNYHILPYFIGDLIERGSFVKSQIQDLVIEILLQCCKTIQDTTFILSEIHKKIEAKHPKIMTLCLTIIEKILEQYPNHLVKDQIRDFIELCVSLVQHTNKVIRQKSINIFCKLYQMISESFEQVKKTYLDKRLRQIQIKELEQLCSKITKKTQKIDIQSIQPTIQIIDLHTLLPDKFFEMPYYKHNEKKNITEQFAKNLEKYDGDIDNSKDYGSIYAIIITLLEESNYLIYSQGMRCVKGLVRLLRRGIPQPVAKHFFILILDKLKGSLSKPLQSAVFNLLEDILIYENISCDQFMELMINQLESSKNIGLKIACARWFKDGWLALALAVQTGSYESSDSEVLKKFAQSNSEKIQKSLLILYKKVQCILKKENNLNYKKVLLDLINSMQCDEQNLQVTVIESQIAIVNPQLDLQESRITDKQSRKQQQMNSVKSRYQTEEDLCEFAQIGEEMQNFNQANRNRQSIELPTSQLNKEQIEFMNKFSNDLIQLRKLSQNNQDHQIQNKIEEIINSFKIHYSDKNITSNDFLQQMTNNIIIELVHFCKNVQVQKKLIADKLYDFIISLLIKMNKIQVTLDQEMLYQEYKICLIQLNQLDISKLLSLLDSLYICNSLESMIKIGYRIINKYLQKQTNTNIKILQAFINWITQKINAATQQQLDPSFIRTSQKTFENTFKMFPQTQLDIRLLLNALKSRMINQQVEQLDQYQDLLNQSQRKSKSKSFGSQSRFSPYETPNKTQSKLEFSDSEEQESLESLQQIEQQISTQFTLQSLEKFIHYLNRHRAYQLCNQSQHTVFLSPNSSSPGKHWRRGIGRDNMIISSPNRQLYESTKFEDFTKILEIICQNFNFQVQNQVFQVFYLLKHIFPNCQQCLIYLIFAYICPKTEYSENFEVFLSTFLQLDKSIMAYQYRQAFNILYQKQENEKVLINLIHTGFNFLFQKIFENDLLVCIQYFISTLTYMLTQNMFYQLANDLLSKYQQQTNNFNQIVENELINYKKLYDTYLNWLQVQQQTYEKPQIDFQKLYKQQQNDILIVDLQEIDECASKREETVREHINNSQQENFIHINKEDFELLESTAKNFLSQQTLRFNEEGQSQQTDILNIQQFISPLQQISQISNQMHDTVIQDLAKNLYSNDTHRLKELDMIKLQNDTYRQHKRDSNKQVQESYPQVPLKDPMKQKIEKIYEEVQNESVHGNFNEKSLLVDVLAPIETTSLFDQSRNLKRNECIQQMQEILLTSTSLYFDVASTLLLQYENLDMAEDKLAFINDLKLSLVNQTLLTNINQQNFSVIIAIVLKLCTTPATQSEIYNSSLGYDDNQLTKSLQQILDVLLHSKDTEQVLICLIHVFNDHLPMDFTNEISKNEKMMLRLNLKCIERLIQNSEKLHVFGILIEILKFFKCHPPENLIEGLPSIKELELYFRQLKQITDSLLNINFKEGKEFLDFVYRKNNKSIFLDYVKSVIEKK
ncbi:unnamed protein product [Paramecium pentaurelia]|uniref:TOG domain-containing protein n=1 Tax=Paramecium pentaurelia TaxID=43138 RepID=A0A8S1TSA3_9CILI|nr:unnamed protein product [Paramecium pentaurelia]